jgi:hypothetical protein
MKYELFAGSKSQKLLVLLRDATSSVGAGKTNLDYTTNKPTVDYCRPGEARVGVTLATQTVTGAYSSGGFVKIDDTNMPGLYRFDPPDAALVRGAPSVVFNFKADALNVIQEAVEIVLSPTFGDGTVDDSGAAAGDFDTTLTEATADFWKGTYCRFVSGNLNGQVRKVTGYTFGTKGNLAFSDPFTAAPDNSSNFVLINR